VISRGLGKIWLIPEKFILQQKLDYQEKKVRWKSIINVIKMGDEEYYLGFDVGTSGIKTALIDSCGKIIAIV